MAFGRKAELELGADNRRLKRDLRRATRDLHTFGRTAARSLKTSFTAGIGSLATLGSAAGLAAIGKTAFDNEEALTRMGIQAGRSMDAMRGAASAIAVDYGMARQSVIGAASALVDLKGASAATVENMRLLSKASAATGAEVKDLAGTYYALDNAFKFRNAAEAEKALSGVIEAGKRGSIPLAEMSTTLQQQATSLAKLTKNAGDAAAMLQIVRKGFGSAAEAGTGVKALVNTFEGAAAKLKAVGIRVYTKDGDGNRVLRDIDNILDQVEKKNLLNHRNYTWAMGSAEARKALEMLIEHRDQYDQIRAAAARSNAVQEDSARFLSSNAGRMRRALARVRVEFESLFTRERLDAITGAASKMADVVGFAIDHFGTLISAASAVIALHFAVKMASWSNALLALNKGIAGSAAGLDGLAGKSGKLGRLTATLGKLGAVAASAAAGWSVGTMIADGLGLHGSGVTDRDRDLLARQKAQLARHDDFVNTLASGRPMRWAGRALVPNKQKLAALREMARKVQAGTATTDEQSQLARVSQGRFLFADSGLRDDKGNRVYNTRQDIVKEIRRLERAVALDAANTRNQTLRGKWDAGGDTKVAERLIRAEVKGGDRLIRRDEILHAIEREGLLPEFVSSSRGKDRELDQAKFNAMIEKLVEKVAETTSRAVAEQYRSIAGDLRVELSVDGAKMLAATSNTQHAARSPAP